MDLNLVFTNPFYGERYLHLSSKPIQLISRDKIYLGFFTSAKVYVYIDLIKLIFPRVSKIICRN